MKTLFTAFIVLFCTMTLSQKEILGKWNLQYMGSPTKTFFDIEDNNGKDPLNETNVSVEFKTKSDSVNNSMTRGSYEVFKNSYYHFKKGKKVIWCGAYMINNVWTNEVYAGKYSVDKKNSSLHILIKGKSGTIIQDATFNYEIIDDTIILIPKANENFQNIYKKDSN